MKFNKMFKVACTVVIYCSMKTVLSIPYKTEMLNSVGCTFVRRNLEWELLTSCNMTAVFEFWQTDNGSTFQIT
jgi:hypothetical protein